MLMNPINPSFSSSMNRQKNTSSLLDEVDQFLQSENNFSIDSVNELLDAFRVLNNQNDYPLARAGLGRLLSIKSEYTQLKAIQYLKPFLNVITLRYDVMTNQSHALLDLENDIKQAIDSTLMLNGSSELIFALLDLYQDLIERLWLISYLIQDHEVYTLIVEQKGAIFKGQAKQWQPLLAEQDGQISQIWFYLQRWIHCISVPLGEEAKEEMNNKLKNECQPNALPFI